MLCNDIWLNKYEKTGAIDRLVFSWWRHQMETFSALLAICAGNSPHKGQWRGALVFSLICVWINDWLNNHEAGDLRRYRAHCDVTVMSLQSINQLHLSVSDKTPKIDYAIYNKTMVKRHTNIASYKYVLLLLIPCNNAKASMRHWWHTSLFQFKNNYMFF